MRKKYSAQFKAKVVQEILKEEKSMSELASEYGVHITQLRKWKAKVLESLPTIFDGDQAYRQQLKELETEQEKLYAEIGRLTCAGYLTDPCILLERMCHLSSF